ncbi:hypothetical protein DTO169C6_3892 [Paecilomyces variotii]|nr:hypothetical protein DTO169C6_3892 [Paecilomyces variotii]
MPLLMDGPRSTRMAPFYVVDSRRLERQIIRETTTDNERMDAAITIEMALIREERLTNLADTGIASKRGVINAFIIFQPWSSPHRRYPRPSLLEMLSVNAFTSLSTRGSACYRLILNWSPHLSPGTMNNAMSNDGISTSNALGGTSFTCPQTGKDGRSMLPEAR